MKAILVIDIPSNDIKKYFVRYDLYHSGGINNMSELKTSYFAELKPMPERKKVIPIFTHNRENAKLEIANQNKGFNDCIDEILSGNKGDE